MSKCLGSVQNGGGGGGVSAGMSAGGGGGGGDIPSSAYESLQGIRKMLSAVLTSMIEYNARDH